MQEYNKELNAWIEEVQNYRGIDAERTLKCCLNIEQYAQDTKDSWLLGFAYYYSGETYYLLNDVENLFKNITKAISYLDQSKQWVLAARAYNIMAITSYSRGNAPIAMDYYLTGLNYCRKYGLLYEECMINQNVGTLYMNLEQYVDAQHYFERSYAYLKENCTGDEACKSSMACLCISLGKCYMYRGMYERAQKCIDRLDKEFLDCGQNVDILYGLCFKIAFYHRTGKVLLRDENITKMHERLDDCIAIMDLFDDIYDICQLLLEIGKEEELWNILSILEELTKQAKLINFQRKIIAIKIKYYRKHRDNACYLQATGLYYELTDLMEQENKYMIASMVNVRSSLERANERRRKVEAANEQLMQKSETDQLTGLSNRYRLNDYSEKIFEECLNEGKTLAVEILDIDFFKQYNDNYGHQSGDECIKMIASQLDSLQDEHTFCARYGGDEFVILYDDMSQQEVLNKAAGLRQSIMDIGMEHLYSEAEPFVTISQGICFDIPGERNKCWDFLHTADMMLYRVKRKCRNNVCIGSLDFEEIQIQF